MKCTFGKMRGFSKLVENKVLENGREITTMKKEISGSPLKLNLLAKQISGMMVEDAQLQMKFSHKRKAKVVHQVIQNAINLADMRYEIEPKQLKITKAFVGKGRVLKRIRMMGKGQHGTVNKKSSHLTVVVQETQPKSE